MNIIIVKLILFRKDSCLPVNLTLQNKTWAQNAKIDKLENWVCQVIKVDRRLNLSVWPLNAIIIIRRGISRVVQLQCAFKAHEFIGTICRNCNYVISKQRAETRISSDVLSEVSSKVGGHGTSATVHHLLNN